MSGGVVLAIDPGFTGAIALYDAATGRLDIDDMPVLETKTGKTRMDVTKLLSVIELSAAFASVCVIEAVSAMPRQGVASAFQFGYGAGLLEGVASAFEIPVVKVPAARWKVGAGIARVGAGRQRSDRKNAARARAIEVFPKHADKFARVKDDGRAEAALLAWWYATTARVKCAQREEPLS